MEQEHDAKSIMILILCRSRSSLRTSTATWEQSNLTRWRACTMIPDDEPFKYAEPQKPSKPNPELEKQLDAMGFRPFGIEW